MSDDFNQLMDRLPVVFGWLLSTPWWVPSGLAAALTVFLIWLAWPRAVHNAASSAFPVASEAVKIEVVKPGRISTVRLVPSGEAMALVVTPNLGGVTVGLFVDISHWTPQIIASGWPTPDRFYLGDFNLRAPNLKFSLTVFEQNSKELSQMGLGGWLLKSLNSEGKPSGTVPCFTGGRQRTTFVFIGPDGREDEFRFVLVFGQQSKNGHPVVVSPDDFPA